MAHIHEEYLTIKISKLMKGDHKNCPCIVDLSDESREGLEAVIADLLNDSSLIVELETVHDHGDTA